MNPLPSVRLPWVDHIRTGIILLVVHMHACVTYSHVGDWYAMDPIEPSMAQKVPFIVWQAHLQAFFMGLLFLLAGYFAEGSLARRGARAFLRERLWRLGVPALFYMLVIHPFIVRGLNPWGAKFRPVGIYYRDYLLSGKFLGESGPLWFAVALLIFCVALALWRTLAPPRTERQVAGQPPSPPRTAWFWVVGGLLGIATFLTRLVQPIGTNVLNLQLCFFPQYIAFFAIGLAAARGNWLVALARSPHALRAGAWGLVVGPAVLGTLLVIGGGEGVEAFFGGWHWQALGYALWEQLTGVALSLGMLAWFSRHVYREHPIWRFASDRSFAVYVLHAPVLVALMMAFRGLPYHLYGLVALLTFAGILVSFALADLVRRLPGVSKIL